MMPALGQINRPDDSKSIFQLIADNLDAVVQRLDVVEISLQLVLEIVMRLVGTLKVGLGGWVNYVGGC